MAPLRCWRPTRRVERSAAAAGEAGATAAGAAAPGALRLGAFHGVSVRHVTSRERESLLSVLWLWWGCCRSWRNPPTDPVRRLAGVCSQPCRPAADAASTLRLPASLTFVAFLHRVPGTDRSAKKRTKIRRVSTVAMVETFTSAFGPRRPSRQAAYFSWGQIDIVVSFRT